MIIKQIEVDYLDNFSYIVVCEESRKAMVIDPGPDAEQLVALAQEDNLKIANKLS